MPRNRRLIPVKPESRQFWEYVVFAKDQPQYLQLPANRKLSSDGEVETKWKLSWLQRLDVLLFGTVYLHVLTYHKPLQPVRLSTSREEN